MWKRTCHDHRWCFARAPRLEPPRRLRPRRQLRWPPRAVATDGGFDGAAVVFSPAAPAAATPSTMIAPETIPIRSDLATGIVVMDALTVGQLRSA